MMKKMFSAKGKLLKLEIFISAVFAYFSFYVNFKGISALVFDLFATFSISLTITTLIRNWIATKYKGVIEK